MPNNCTCNVTIINVLSCLVLSNTAHKLSYMGGLSLSRNSYLRTHVKFTRLNVEAMYDRPRINVKVEHGSNFA